MNYPVSCECGITRRVASSLAGVKYSCSCGRVNEVPSLSALKAAVGQHSMGIEYRLREMLKLGILPTESKCLLCESATTGVAFCWARCERPYVTRATSIWYHIFLTFLIGWVGILISAIYSRREGEVHGNYTNFRLPLRVCGKCTEQLRDARTLELTLLDVPINAELLDKYPATEVSLDIGLAALTKRDDLK